MTTLSKKFTCYFHDPNSQDWSNESYEIIGDINNVDDFLYINGHLRENIHQGMFFLMRDGVFPSWNAEANLEGSTFTFKITKKETARIWGIACAQMIGETLLREEYRDKYWNIVNGITVSPKKNFCIVKIWLRKNDIISCKNDFTKYFNVIAPDYQGEILFKFW